MKIAPWAIALICVAMVLALVGGAVAWAEGYATKDLRWYTDNPSASEYTIRTAGELRAFSDLVNGVAVDDDGDLLPPEAFQGKKVTLANSISLFGGSGLVDAAVGAVTPEGATGELYPIGSADTPFLGEFDGNGKTVSGLVVGDSFASEIGYQYIGLFGYAGAGSVIHDVELADDCSIAFTCADQAQQVAYVGGAVGAADGSLRNVTNRGSVSVTWDDGNSGMGRSVDRTLVATNIAGVAGKVAGTLERCVNTGAVTLHVTASSTYVASTGKDNPIVASFVAGVAGQAASAQSCINRGTVTAYTTGTGGKDRFGQAVAAQTNCVGGIVAQCTGSIESCTNGGDIVTSSYIPDQADAAKSSGYGTDLMTYKMETADGGGAHAGGIVGQLVPDASQTVQPGQFLATVKGCANTGYILGLNDVGGIVGLAAPDTLITECVNGDASKSGNSRYENWGRVMSTRWNKPCTGGIAGNTSGSVSYSRNHGQVDTGQAGYYIGGIVGNLVWQGRNTDAQKSKPELYSCYNTGQVDYSSSLRRGGIVGGSSGHVHDCLFLYGTLNRSEDAGLGAIGEDYGTYSNIRVAYASDRSARQNSADEDPIVLTTKDATGFLNRTRITQGWDTYWVTNSQVNRAYPVIGSADDADGDVDLPALSPTATLVRDARYTAAYNPTPTLKVTIVVDGQQQELVERADYVVVPDPAAQGQGITPNLGKSNRPYQATIRGIGAYKGTPDVRVAYGIERGDFSECTVSVASAMYTGQAMNDPEVTVFDAGGAEVDPKGYTYVVNDGKDCVQPTTVGIDYRVVCDATKDGNYAGHAEGAYIIERIDIANDCDVVGVVWENRVWYYDDELHKVYEVNPVLDAKGNLVTDEKTGFPQVEGLETYTDDAGRQLTKATPKQTDENGSPVYGLQLQYTGAELNPDVIGILWNGQVMPKDWYNVLLGTGDPGEITATVKNIEATDSAALTVTYNSSKTRNYDIINFEILPAQLTPDDMTVKYARRVLTYQNGSPVGDPSITVQYGKNTVDEKNYKVTPAYSVDSDGQKHYGADISYELRSDLYYTISFAEDGSVQCAHITDVGPFTVANGQTSINEDFVQLEFVGGSSQYSFAGFSAPDVRLTNTRTGEVLKADVDYEVKSFHCYDNELMRFTGASYFASMPRVWIQGLGNYTGQLEKRYELQPIQITNSTFSPSWPYLSSDGRAMMQNCNLQSGYVPIGDYDIILPYRQNGYDAIALGEVLGISWHPDALNGMTGSVYGGLYRSGMFCVKAIEDSAGRSVDAIAEPGTYQITVAKDPHNSNPLFVVSDDFLVRRTVTIVPISLGNAFAVTLQDGTAFSTCAYYGITIRTTYEFGYAQSMSLSPQFVAKYDGSQRAYTGNPVLPKYQIVDSGLLDTPFNGQLTQYPNKGNSQEIDLSKLCVLDSSEIVPEVLGYPDGPIEAGTYQVVRVWAAEGSMHVNGKHKISPDVLSDNTFSIVPADISNKDLVTIKADPAFYEGGPVAPRLHFFIDEEECNYVEGEDYELICTNNVQVAKAEDENPPLATIRILNKNHLVAYDEAGNLTDELAIPFTIDYSLVDLAAAQWKFAETAALAEGYSDGRLAGAAVSGTYKLSDLLPNVPVPEDAYTVQPGAYEDDKFLPKETGWVAGGKVWFKIASNGTNPVFGGTAIVGPATVVEADAARSFTHAGGEGCALSAVLVEDTFTYAGRGIEPLPVVKNGDEELTLGFDYSLAYEDNVNVGEAAAVTVCGIGSYTGTMPIAFAIAPASLASCEAVADDAAYAGTQICPSAQAVHVRLGEVELPQKDWALVASGFGENVNAGEGTFQVAAGASGNLEGQQTGTFTITPIDITDSLDAESGDESAQPRFSLAVDEKEFTGEAIRLNGDDVRLVDELTRKSLVQDVDFRVQYPGDATNAGSRELIVSGIGNYIGNRAATLVVSPLEITAANVELEKEGYRYAGVAIEPVVKVAVGDRVLEEAYTDAVGELRGDYRLEYRNNMLPGTNLSEDGPAVVVSGVGNYAGTLEVPFSILANTMTSENTQVVVKGAPFVYTGGAITPQVEVLLNGQVLPEDDYEVAYADNTGIGQATVTVTAKEPNFLAEASQPVTATFQITERDIAACGITCDPSAPYAFGEAVIPAITVKSPNGETLAQGTDYTVSYADNVNVGKASATVSGVGTWGGSKTLSFQVTKVDIAQDAIVLEPATFTYDGKEHVPAVTVTVGGRQLQQGADYQVRFLGDKKTAGQQVVEVYTPATSNYRSSATATYEIVKDASEPSQGASGQGDSAENQKPSTPTNLVAAGAGSAKKANPMIVKAKKIALKAKGGKLAKKVVVKKAKAFTVVKAKGAVSFKKVSGNKKIAVSKAGKVAVKKGLKKGTYKIKVEVTAAGDASYASKVKAVKLKVTIR